MFEDLKYKAIFDSAIDAIIIITQSGIIENVNPAAMELFGYDAKELIGQNVNILMPNPHAHQHNGYLSNYIKTRKKKIIGIGRNVKGKKKDGSLFPLRLAVSEIRRNGQSSFIGILHDQTQIEKARGEIKQINLDLEKSIEEKTKELVLLLEKEKELNDLKSKFVSLVSHEFRTPLSTILSSISIIHKYTEDAKDKDKIENHIHKIKRSIKNLNNILSDLLTLSSFDEEKVEEQKEWFDLTALLEDVKNDCTFMLTADKHIHIDLSPGSVQLYCNKNFIKNIFFNLVSNSIKFLGLGKNIHCGAIKGKDKIMMYVKDEGIGIPTKEQDKLFTRFYRASNAQNIEGTGLGLNIVKKYVELLEGTVSFKTSKQGTTFNITIPLKK